VKARWIHLVLTALSVLAIVGTTPAAYAQKTTLRMWTFLATTGTDPRSTALKTVVDNFNKSQTQYTVEVESIPFARIDNSVIQATAAGQGPDILNVYSDQLALHVAAKTIVPLDELIAKEPETFRNDFVTKLDFFAFDGKRMAVPWETRVWLLWYRADLLKKAGAELPKTLDELASTGAKLTTDQVMGFGFGASTGALGAGAIETFTPLLWAAGGDLFDASGKATVNSPAGVRVLTWMRDLTVKKAMRPSVVSMTIDDVMSSIKAGTMATTILGSFRVAAGRAASATGANLQTAPIPGWTADKPAPARLAGQTLTVGANTKHREGAWRFINHYLSPESQLLFARAGVMPSRLSTYNNAYFKDDPAGAEMRVWTGYARDHGRIGRTPSDFNKLSEEVAKAIQSVLVQGTDPKQALDAAAAAYNAAR
jgi:multiple sugar transport system substrate-binding protein